MAQCAATFKPIENQVLDEKDLMLRSNTIMNPMKNNETELVRDKRGSCCTIFHWKCCCSRRGRQCVSGGNGAQYFGYQQCHYYSGDYDCEGCDIGWKC